VPPNEPKIATFKAKWDDEYRKRWGLENQFAEDLDPQLVSQIEETCKRIYRLLTIDGYVGFVTTMLLAFGIVLEFPIVLIGLARVGILNYRRLAAQRRLAVVTITLFAIVITPGGDPISPIILGSVMYLLFEGSLFVIRLIRR